MIIEVLVYLSLDFLDPLIERLEDLLPRFADKLGQASVAKPVADLRALLNQIIKVTNERLKFLLLRLRRRPGLGVMAQALARDQRGIGAIGLVALQFALAEGLDLRRIDYANQMPCAMKAFGQVEAISAGGFHHGVDSPHALFGKPGLQSSKPIRRVGELALFNLHCLRIANQGYVKGLFADVNSEFRRCHCGTPHQVVGAGDKLAHHSLANTG
jgi:hypothetical protein